MATEITEFTDPPMMYGSVVPLRPLPYLRHTVLQVGTVLTIGADTTSILLTPGEDVRLAATAGNGAQADPAPDGLSMLLKAGIARDFAVHKGTKIKAVAA